MFKKAICFVSCITALLSSPLFAKPVHTAKNINPCLTNMDNEIGILYICGYGGKFKVLSLSRCHLQDKDIQEVASYLDKNPRINALELGENNLSDAGMEALSRNKTLAWLNVSYNHISDNGAAAIAQI